VDATGSASGVPPSVAVRLAGGELDARQRDEQGQDDQGGSEEHTAGCSSFPTQRRRSGAPPTKLQIDDLDAELIADFLTHIETERRNGARPKLRAKTRASNDRDGRASTRRESGRLRV
jgi:hypothetical protein